MSTYQGMRWFKCDLQVQTPEDAAHWLDSDLQLGNPRRPSSGGERDETGIQEKARRFLTRCHDLGLQAIAVTDHNFSTKTEPRDWFLTHLVEQSRFVAKDLERDPLVIFPGFEVDIGYHVLCLFAPAKKLSHIQRVSMILTKLGLPENERFKGRKPQPLRYNNQYVSLKTLLEVVQDEHQGIAVAAHADQKDGVFEDPRNTDDFRLHDLLCVELTRYPPAKRIAEILNGKNRDWSRQGVPPAAVLSSDVKSLQPEADGSPKANALGYRYSWIKMSEPSIEGLRQAFLDNESRIRLPDDIATDVNPAERQHHARILSLSVSGASFVVDQSLSLSPNLNCIIGGRGSGKSTLLEYLRLALRKDSGDDVRDDQRTKEKIARIRNTISDPSAEVRVQWLSRDGVEDTIVLDTLGGARVEGREVLDLDTFFRGLPVRFFSQQQLTQLTEKERNNLLSLIDDFARADMDVLEAQERELRAEISRLFEIRRQRAVLDGERKRLEQEAAELNRQRKARAGLQAAAERHERLQAANKFVERIRADWSEPRSLVESAEDFVASHSPLGSVADTWPHGQWFHTLDKSVEEAKDQLLADVKVAVESYQKQIAGLFDKDPEWPTIKQDLDKAERE